MNQKGYKMSTHGGKRKGAGPPPFYTEGPMKRTTLYLPVSMIERLRKYGDGNVSHGIRALVERHLLKTRR